MSESGNATTGEMRAVSREVAAVTAALSDFRSEVQGSLARLTEAITKLVKLEEHQAAQDADLVRVTRWLENHEQRLHKMEVESARADERGNTNTLARRNVERVLIAVVSGGTVLVLPQVFKLVVG